MTTDTIYEITPEKCIRCGLCRKDCPAGCIIEEEGFLVINQDSCIQCGHCGAICPEGAVTCDGEELIPVGEMPSSADEVFSLVAGKRSVRNYRDREIPRDVLDRIVETGSLTGTASNGRDVQVKVLTGEDVVLLRRGLCFKLLGLIKILDNPVGRQIARWAGMAKYADKKVLKSFRKRLTDGAEGTGDPLFFHAPAVMIMSYPGRNKRFGRTNAVMAGQSMMLYAHSLGIESCVIGFAEVAAAGKKGKEILGIGKDREVGMIFTLGYGVPRYYRLPGRRSIEVS